MLTPEEAVESLRKFESIRSRISGSSSPNTIGDTGEELVIQGAFTVRESGDLVDLIQAWIMVKKSARA